VSLPRSFVKGGPIGFLDFYHSPCPRIARQDSRGWDLGFHPHSHFPASRALDSRASLSICRHWSCSLFLVLTLDLMACEGSSVLEEVETTGATNLTEVLWQEERAESSSVDHSSNAGPDSAASSQDHSANYSTQSSALNNFTKSKKDRNLLNGCSLAKHSEGGGG
jgi:hypothetical protein